MREREARVAAAGDDGLEAALPRGPSIVRATSASSSTIEHDAVAGLDVVAVVLDVAGGEERRIELARCRREHRRRLAGGRALADETVAVASAFCPQRHRVNGGQVEA